MNAFYHDLSKNIFRSKGYLSATEELFSAYIANMANEKYEIKIKTIKQLSSTIQAFYRSENEKYLNEGSILLSMLLNVIGEKSDEIVIIADHLFSQSGDYPNVELLKKMYNKTNFKVSIIDEARKDLRRELNSVEEIDHALTDYQRSLWEELITDVPF